MKRRHLIAGAVFLVLAAVVFDALSGRRHRRGRGVAVKYRRDGGGVLEFSLGRGRLLELYGASGRGFALAVRGNELLVLKQGRFSAAVKARLPAARKGMVRFGRDFWEVVCGGEAYREALRVEAFRPMADGVAYQPPVGEVSFEDDFMRAGADAGRWEVLGGRWFLSAGTDPQRSNNPFALCFGERERLRPDPLLAERLERERFGIGIAVGSWKGMPNVARVSVQAPAARAGVREEDIILAAEGLETNRGFWPGKRDGPVRLTLLRPSTGAVLKKEIPKERYRWGEVLRPVPLQGGGEGPGLIAAGVPVLVDGAAAVSVRPGCFGAGGLAWRVEGEGTFLAVRLAGAGFDSEGARVEAVRFRDGRPEVLASETFPVWPEAFYRLGLRVKDGKAEVFVDGRLVLVFDPGAGFGKAGLCAWLGGGGRKTAPVLFDDFMCSNRPFDFSFHPAQRFAGERVMSREEAMVEWAAARGEWRRSGEYFYYAFPLYADFEVEVSPPREVVVLKEVFPSRLPAEPGDAVLRVEPSADGRCLVQGAGGGPAGGVTGTVLRVVRSGDGGFAVEGGSGTVRVPGTGVRWYTLAVRRAERERAFPEGVRVRDEGVWDERFGDAPAGLAFLSGFWGVANKWVCDPRFSWLAARGTETSQAWWKGEIRGDFTLDFYVATFMEMSDEPFERNGDMGVALSGRTGDLGGGYFFSIGEDFDRVSRLYRMGRMVAENAEPGKQLPSNHLTLPLRQEFHRHWAHVRVSRRGRNLRYELDGKEVLSWEEDGKELDARFLGIMAQRTGFLLSRVRLNGEISPGGVGLPEPPAVFDEGGFTNLWGGTPLAAVRKTPDGLEVEQKVSGPMLLVRKAPFRLGGKRLVVRYKPLRGNLRLGVYVLPYNPDVFHWSDEYGDGRVTGRPEPPPGPPFEVFRPRLFDQGLLLYAPLEGEFPDNAPFTRLPDVERRELPDGSVEVSAPLELPYPYAEYAVDGVPCVAVIGMLHLDGYAMSSLKCNRPGSAFLVERFEVKDAGEEGLVRFRHPGEFEGAGWEEAPFEVGGVRPKRWEPGEDGLPPGRTVEAVFIRREDGLFLTPTKWAGLTNAELMEGWSPFRFPLLELRYRAERRISVSPVVSPPGFSVKWGDGLDDRTEWALRDVFLEPVPPVRFEADGREHLARFNLLRTMGEDARGGWLGRSVTAGVYLGDEGWRGLYPGMGVELLGVRFVPLLGRGDALVVSGEGVEDWRLSVDTKAEGEPEGREVVLPALPDVLSWREVVAGGSGVEVVTADALGEGLMYAHVKVKRNGEWGPAESWPVFVDVSPPRVEFEPAPPGDGGLLFGSFRVDDAAGLDLEKVRLVVALKDVGTTGTGGGASRGRFSYKVGRGLQWDPVEGRLSLRKGVLPEWAEEPVEATLQGVADCAGNSAADFGPLEVYPDGRVVLAGKEVRAADEGGGGTAGVEMFFLPDRLTGAPSMRRVESMVGGANFFEETLGELRPFYNVRVRREAGAGLGGGYGGVVRVWPGEWRVKLLERYIKVASERYFVMSYRVEGAVEKMWVKVRLLGDEWAVYPVGDLAPGWHTAAFDLRKTLGTIPGSSLLKLALRVDLVGDCGGVFDPERPAGKVFLDALGTARRLRLRIAPRPGRERVRVLVRSAGTEDALGGEAFRETRLGIHPVENFPGKWLEAVVLPLNGGEASPPRMVRLEPEAPARYEGKW